MANQHWSSVVIQSELLPVFDGLDKVGLSGKDIADVVGVSPPTVSKWRHAKANVPGDIIALLTLLLGNRIEELHDRFSGSGGVSGNWHMQARAGLDAALEDLRAQERLNKALPTEAVRGGAKLFRHWWIAEGRMASAEAGTKTHEVTDVTTAV